MEELIESDSTLRATSRRYAEFCQAVKIGTFPISLSSIALFMVAKCSNQNGHYRTSLRQLQNLRIETEDMWQQQFVEFNGWEDVDVIERGLRNFMEERKSVQVKIPPGSFFSFPAFECDTCIRYLL